MTAIGEIGASSFDSYEGIRIVIPGVVMFSAGYSVYLTVTPGASRALSDDTLLSVVASLVTGLILYFWDLPAKSAAFNELLPTDFLERKFPDQHPGNLLTSFLLILNSKMPAATRNRALYMGSMYRIGLEMILALSATSSIAFGAALFDYGAPLGGSGPLARRLAAIALAVTFVVGLMISNGYDRKEALRLRQESKWKLSAATANLTHRTMWIYATGLLLLVLPALPVVTDRLLPNGRAVLACGGLAVCIGYWLQRYVRGDRSEENPRKRSRLRAPSAALLFALPNCLALGVYAPPAHSVLTAGPTLAGWSIVACLSTLSIVIRGHERKLHGTYRGQTRWLESYPDEYADIVPGLRQL